MTPNLTDIRDHIITICQDRGISFEEVIKSIEKAIATAYRKEFGDQSELYACEYDMDTGRYKIYKETRIVEEVVYPAKEQLISEARLYNPNVQLDDIIKEEVMISDEINFGRIAAQIAGQVLKSTINTIRQSHLIQEYKGQIGSLVKVEIDIFKKNSYLAKLGTAMINIPLNHILPREKFTPGQIVRFVIVDIKEDQQGNYFIILSRTAPEFVEAVIRQEVPELDAGLIVIKKIAREAGSRTKILVASIDPDDNIDPVGAILGKKNVRLMTIMRELNPKLIEKIDIIEYLPEEIETMIADALEPAELDNIVYNEENNSADVYCNNEEAALAVGKKGINIKLASKLLNMNLNLIAPPRDDQNDQNDDQNNSSDDNKEEESDN
jgi:transcription termination/antitermination protein NusA